MLVLLAALLACKGGSSSSASGPAAKIGDTVSFDDSDWVVIEAKDAGKKLKSNSEFSTEEKTSTDGHFIQVHYKVTNKGKKEEALFDGPKIIDSKSREFGHIDSEPFFIPAHAKSIVLESLQPSMPKEFWTVIEVPTDATGLKFQIHGFSLLGDKKNVDLGI